MKTFSIFVPVFVDDGRIEPVTTGDRDLCCDVSRGVGRETPGGLLYQYLDLEEDR